MLSREIAGTQIRIYYDGLIEIRRQDLDKKLYPSDRIIRERDILTEAYGEYLRLINALYVCLDIGCMEATCGSPFQFDEITRRDIARATYVNGKFRGSEIPTKSIGGHYLEGRFPDAYRAKRPMANDPRFFQRCLLKPSTIEVGLKHFETISQKPEMIEKLATFAKALSDFNVANFSTSIVLCWFLLERSLNERYEAFLSSKASSGQHNIDGKRRKFLTGRDFTAAVITQVLALEGVLDHAELHSLNKIRKHRNDIAHHLSDELPNSRDCESALNFTLKFMLQGLINEPRVCLFWELRESWPH